jgi:hypothetical protein
MPPRALTSEQIAEVVAAHLAGESAPSIAARYGCSSSNVLHHSWNARNPDKKRVRKPSRIQVDCIGCGTTFIRLGSMGGKGRVYCTEECKTRTKEQAAAEKTAQLVAEIEWIKVADTWQNVALRVGFPSLDALEQWLTRHDQHELATQLRAAGITNPWRMAA